MSMAIDFDAIRHSYPLDSVVGANRKLVRSGRNKLAVCPFHSDRSPSLVLYPDNTYHCFGCGQHGDVIDYIAGTQHLDISEAIRFLTGGQAPRLDDADQMRREREARHREAELKRKQENATLAARERWARALAVNGSGNAYLERKNVAPYGCRREGDNLLVPMYGPDGLIQSVQSIEPDGRKLFHASAPAKGAVMTLGNASDGPVVVVEGFATGATVQAATGLLVYVGFSKGALLDTARIAAQRCPGREIIVAADVNGVEAAEKAARAVNGRVVVPELLGAEGSDFNDQAAHYGLEDVAALFRSREATPLPLSVLIPADWQGARAPERRWKVEGLVPDRQATLLTGAGAAGKSLVSQLLCTCSGMGLAFLGVPVEECVSLYVTCEDDPEELHRRQEAICNGLGISLAATRGRVFLISLYGELGNELCTFDEKRSLVVADRYRHILETALHVGARLIVLDNTSHLFTGNENARSEVAAFVNLCNGLAREIDGAVIMVGFPNKAGDSYSGSTAWENQVRSRLFLETPKNDDGVVIDPDYRILRNEKANYARKGTEIGFVWSHGTFVLPADGEGEAPVSHNFTDHQAYDALREIDRRWQAKNPFSAAHNSPERYLGTWLRERYKLSGRAASEQIKRWGAAEIIRSETYDLRTKKQGLRVVNWPDLPCGSTAEVRK